MKAGYDRVVSKCMYFLNNRTNVQLPNNDSHPTVKQLLGSKASPGQLTIQQYLDIYTYIMT